MGSFFYKAIFLLGMVWVSMGRLSGQEAKSSSVDTVAIAKELALMGADSLVIELRAMLDSMGKGKSFVSVSFSLSNRLFSDKNNAFNAQQANTGVTAFSPSATYLHKSGFGMGATGYVRNFDGVTALYQTALSPSYDRIGSKAMYGISYTYYAKGNAKKISQSDGVTPFDHEVYAYIQSRKTWLRPALAVGWAKGGYQDVAQRTDPRFPNRVLYDTTQVQFDDFSLNASVSHTFSAAGLLSTKDLLIVIPQLSLIGGLQQYSVTTKTASQPVRPRDARLDRFRNLYKVSNSEGSAVALQTFAASVSMSWNLSAFSVSSGYFLGYALDAVSGGRFSQFFNMGIGYVF